MFKKKVKQWNKCTNKNTDFKKFKSEDANVEISAYYAQLWMNFPKCNNLGRI